CPLPLHDALPILRLGIDLEQVPAHLHHVAQVREHRGDELARRARLVEGGQLLRRAAAASAEDHRASVVSRAAAVPDSCASPAGAGSCQVTSRAPTHAMVAANSAAPIMWRKTTSSGRPRKYWT